MADFFARRKAIQEKGADHASLSVEQEDMFPTVATLLAGRTSEDGSEEIPPHSLTLYPGEGEIRFVFSSKTSDEAWFGTAGPDVDVLARIEDALQAGKVEPRREKAVKGKPRF